VFSSIWIDIFPHPLPFDVSATLTYRDPGLWLCEMYDSHNRSLTTPQESGGLFGPDKKWFRPYNGDPAEDRERKWLCLGKPRSVNLFELYSPSRMHSCLLSAIQKETICNNFSISRNCAAPGIQGDRNELWNGLVSVLQLFKSIELRAFLSVCVWLRLKGMSFIAPTQVVPFYKDTSFMARRKRWARFGSCPWKETYVLC